MLGYGMPTKTSAPAYTMTGRDQHGGASVDLAKTPGPGKYDKVPLNVFIRREPAYSMLGRTLYPGGMMQTIHTVFSHDHTKFGVEF